MARVWKEGEDLEKKMGKINFFFLNKVFKYVFPFFITTSNKYET